MKTSAKIILGIYGAFVGAWLAGSAYFWLESHSTVAEPELPPSVSISSDENAYPLFRQLRSLGRTNGYLTAVYDYLNGRTNGVEAAAEMDSIIASKSNVFACCWRLPAVRLAFA